MSRMALELLVKNKVVGLKNYRYHGNWGITDIFHLSISIFAVSAFTLLILPSCDYSLM
jgi:hypothetical protein